MMTNVTRLITRLICASLPYEQPCEHVVLQHAVAAAHAGLASGTLCTIRMLTSFATAAATAAADCRVCTQSCTMPRTGSWRSPTQA
jgi:hypothetical protein